MSLTNFGDMSGTAAGIGATTEKVSSAMKQLSVADMITSIATGIAKAQSALDDAGIEQFKKLANTTMDIGDKYPDGRVKTYNMLQLGFAPHFYFFQKVTIEVSFEVKFHFEEEQAIKVGAKLDVGLEASKTSNVAQSTADKQDAASALTKARNVQTQRQQELTAATNALDAAKKERDTDAPAALTAAANARTTAFNGLGDIDAAVATARTKHAEELAKPQASRDQTIIDSNKKLIDAYDAHKAAVKRKADADSAVPVAQNKYDAALAAKQAADRDVATAEAAAQNAQGVQQQAPQQQTPQQNVQQQNVQQQQQNTP